MIDAMPYQVDGGRRTLLLRSGETGENDSIVAVFERPHDCLTAR